MNKLIELFNSGLQSMEKLFNSFTITIGSVGAMMGYICGAGNEGIFTILVFAMTLDFATGVVCGYLKHKLDSKISFVGIFKKMLIICFVAFAVLVDKYLIKTGTVLSKATIFFYLANEALSLVENSAVLGLPIPSALKTTLVKLRSVSEDSKKEVEHLIADGVSDVAVGVVDSTIDTAFGDSVPTEVKEEIDKEIHEVVGQVVEKVVDTAVDLTVDSNESKDEEVDKCKELIDKQG